jgi:elongation factor Ts
MITTHDIKALREKTGAGVLDCREALTASSGDLDKALEALRAKGAVVAEKRAHRDAVEGYIEAYGHAGRVGVLVELRCETDFVAENAGFRGLAHEIALQVAAQAPRWVSREDVPGCIIDEMVAQEREAALASGKSAEIAERIVAGKLERFYREMCLLEQPYIRDDKETIGGLIQDKVIAFNEKILVHRFQRFELAE